MIYNEQLAQRIREALSGLPATEEKKMFSGICFMVNGKMCVCINKNEMMCRVGPDNFDAAVEMNGCRAMVHNGKTMKGFVFVSEDTLKAKKDFHYWIKMALDFNKFARASRPKRKNNGAGYLLPDNGFYAGLSPISACRQHWPARTLHIFSPLDYKHLMLQT